MLNEENVDIEEFDPLLRQYEELAHKYNQVDSELPSDLFEVRNDLEQLLALKAKIFIAKPHYQLVDTPAKLFLKQEALLKYISIENLKQLCLFENQPNEEAVVMFAALAKDKLFLRGLFARLLRNSGEITASDFALSYFLLCTPCHANFFSWQEVLELFKIHPIYALKLACKHSSYQKQFIEDEHSCHNASTYIAASNLSDDELDKLLPNADDTNKFLQFFSGDKIPTAIATLSKTLLNWIFKKLSIHDAAVQNKETIVNNLLKPLSHSNPELFIESLNNPKLLQCVEEKNIISYFNNPAIDKKTAQLALQQLMDNHPDFLKTIHSPLALTLCQTASCEQFSELMKIESVKSTLKKGINTSLDKTNIYLLFCTTKDETKKDLLLNEHFDLFCSLSAPEILDLATNTNYPFKLPEDKIASLLDNQELWANHTPEQQKNINFALLTGIKEQSLVRLFIKHDAYKETWLRTMINDPKWQNKGIGFFSTKTPSTIVKARAFLKEKGPSPLSRDDIQSLIDLFKTARLASHTYSFYFGSFNLRNETTQKFYDEAANLSMSMA